MNAATVRNVTIDDVWTQTSVYQIRHVQLVICVQTINVLKKIQYLFLEVAARMITIVEVVESAIQIYVISYTIIIFSFQRNILF